MPLTRVPPPTVSVCFLNAEKEKKNIIKKHHRIEFRKYEKFSDPRTNFPIQPFSLLVVVVIIGFNEIIRAEVSKWIDMKYVAGVQVDLAFFVFTWITVMNSSMAARRHFSFSVLLKIRAASIRLALSSWLNCLVRKVPWIVQTSLDKFSRVKFVERISNYGLMALIITKQAARCKWKSINHLIPAHTQQFPAFHLREKCHSADVSLL